MRALSWLSVLVLLGVNGIAAAGGADFALGDGTSVSLPIEAVSWPAVALIIGLRLGAAIRLVASAVSGLTLRLEVVHRWDGKPLMDCPWDGSDRRRHEPAD